jgi:hypothetical protein
MEFKEIPRRRTFDEYPHLLKGHTDLIESMAFSSTTNRLVTASWDKTVRIWNPSLTDHAFGREGSLVAILGGHRDSIATADLSVDGTRIVTTSWDHTTRLWQLESGKALNQLLEQPLLGSVTDSGGIAFDRDNRRSLTFAGTTASLMDVATGNVLATFKGHEVDAQVFRISAAAISPDGRFVVTGAGGFGTEGSRTPTTIRLWHTLTAQLLADLPYGGDPISFVGFTRDGRQFITRAKDPWGLDHEEIRSWDVFLTTQELIDHVKQMVPRCLTLDQRTEWSLSPEPPAWCIEMEKWPYQTEDWKLWLKLRREHVAPPRPDTPEWEAWIRNCKTCMIEAASNEEVRYRTARGDIHRLMYYVENCRTCEFKSTALEEIEALEREQLAQQEEQMYRAAQGNLDQLRTYVSNCEVCALGARARDDINRLEREQASRTQFVAYQNRDLHGGDYQRKNSVDLVTCESICKDNSECVAFSFDRWNRVCFLKSTISSLRVEPRSTTGVRGDMPIPSDANDPVTMQRYRGKRFPGNGYSNLTGSLENCESTCQTSQCIAYSFSKAARRCTLFSEAGEYFSDNGVDSGVKVQPVPQ